METVSLNLNLKGSPKVVRISRADMYDPFENESKVAKYEDELFERSYRLGNVRHVEASKRFDIFSFK